MALKVLLRPPLTRDGFFRFSAYIARFAGFVAGPLYTAAARVYLVRFMIRLGKTMPADRVYRWLLLLLFWAIWIGLPFLSDDDERHRQFLIKLLPVTLTNIPLFFINTELLIPRVLRRRGIPAYLLSITLLIFAFIVLEFFVKSWTLPNFYQFASKHVSKSFFYVIFVTAISTGYGLITFMMGQEKARQEERQERMQSELSFLRSQISPHFIFNVLNSIVYLIRSRSELAEPMTIKLSELLRYMLYESADSQIPLEKEVEYLTNYVGLQKVRFEEDVDIRLRIEGVPDGQVIEPMLMIPFVENAFKHGVGFVAVPVIDIDLNFTGQELRFTVRNKITSEIPEDKDNSSGIGLQNVRRRLELLYPESHRLELNREEEWFTAKLWLRFGRLKEV